MKFLKVFIALTLLLVLLMPNLGFGKKRNLSTPVSRLVGHWQDSRGFEYYFSSVDRSNMTGSLVCVVPNKEKLMKYIEKRYRKLDEYERITLLEPAGRAIYCQYKILSQTLKGEDVQIAIFWPPENYDFPLPEEETFYVNKDGKQMYWRIEDGKENTLTNPFKYIDSKISPEHE